MLRGCCEETASVEFKLTGAVIDDDVAACRVRLRKEAPSQVTTVVAKSIDDKCRRDTFN